MDLDEFDADSQSFASADTDRRDAAPGTTCAQGIEQGDDDSGAASPKRMSEGNRTAVHVYFFGRQFELVLEGERDYGEGFIDLPEVHVGHVPPAPLERSASGGNRRGREPQGLVSVCAEG